MNKPRAGETDAVLSRNLRYVCANGIWYFKKRGGKNAGPFASRNEMQAELSAFITEQKTVQTTTKL